MKRLNLAVAGLAVIFSAISSTATAASYIYCRSDLVKSNAQKTWCNFSSDKNTACVTDTTFGTIDNKYLKNKVDAGKCGSSNYHATRWTEPDGAPKPEPGTLESDKK